MIWKEEKIRGIEGIDKLDIVRYGRDELGNLNWVINWIYSFFLVDRCQVEDQFQLVDSY